MLFTDSRSTRFAVLALSVLAGCTFSSASGSSPPVVTPCTLAEINAGTCTCSELSNAQCPTNFICDVDNTLTCIFQCNQDSDCTGTAAPTAIQTACAAGPLGCECRVDPDTQLTVCFAPPCAQDVNCPSGQLCRNGGCTAAPDPTPTFCRLYPGTAVARVGASVDFAVYSEAPEARLLDPSLVTWSVPADGGLSVQDGGGILVLAPSADPVVVTATIGAATCTSTLRVLQPLEADDALRVVVLDAISGALVNGATVQVEGAPQRVAAAHGIALFSAAQLGPSPDAGYTVSVFDPGYSYLTWRGLSGSDLTFELQPLPAPAGVSGIVPDLETLTSDVHLGAVGLAVESDPSENFYHQYLGFPETTQAEIGSSTDEVPTYSGELIGISNQSIKSTFTALGNIPGQVSSLWGLGGDVQVDQLDIDGDLSDLALQLSAANRELVHWRSTFIMDDTAHPLVDGGLFSQATLTLRSGVGLGLQGELTLPDAPSNGSQSLDRYLISIATHAPGLGRVPLGIAGASNLSPPGRPVVMGDLSTGQGSPMPVHFAPQHHGLEGARVELELIAGDEDLLLGPPTSGLIVPLSSCASQPDGFCENALLNAGLGLLPVPQGGGLEITSRAFTAPGTVDGAPWLRVTLSDSFGTRWDVYGPNADFVLPHVPAGMDDAVEGLVFIQILDLTEEPASLTGSAYHRPGAVAAATRRFASAGALP